MGLSRFLSIILISFFIVACSTPTTRTNLPVKEEQRLEETPQIIENVDYLKRAEVVFAQTGSTEKRDELLLKAADLLQQQGDCVKSLKLLQILDSSLQSQQHKHITQILSTECLITLQRPAVYEHRDLLLAKLVPVIGYEQRVYHLQATLYSQQQAWIKASEALLKTDGDDIAKSQQIWHWLK